jgi:hypothetical protein
MLNYEITTSVRNQTGAWEIIDREIVDDPDRDFDLAQVFAHDIGGEVGQLLLIELRANDGVVRSKEVSAS